MCYSQERGLSSYTREGSLDPITAFNKPWEAYVWDITNVVFDSSFDNCTSLSSTADWFATMRELTAITGLEYLHTDYVYSMREMFLGCRKLTDIDVSHFNTRNVTNMFFMFYCCESLTSLDVTNFDTGNVTDMSYMFGACSKLKSLDVSSFNTAKVIDMSGMFSTCTNLQTIYIGDEWSTDQVENSYTMFEGSTNIVGGDGTPYNPNRVDKSLAFAGGGGYMSFKGDNPSGPDILEPYAALNGTTLTFYYDNKKRSRNGMDIGPFSRPEERGWNAQKASITTVVFDDSFAAYDEVTSTKSWFNYFISLSTIVGLGNLKTDNVTDMGGMFLYCSSLTSLDLSTFNTSNVTNMAGMFQMCNHLQEINMSSFNTSKVVNMSSMFDGCAALRSLNISHFNTSQVTTMNGMFANCGIAIVKPDLSNFNTENVTDMSYMFNGSCFGTLDLSSFNTSKVTDMSNMFADCIYLMFIDMSNFNTSNVSTMAKMFNRCLMIRSLDLTSFNTSAVFNMAQMFYECRNLRSIIVGDDWNVGKVSVSTNMFGLCDQLIKEDGSPASGGDKFYAKAGGVGNLMKQYETLTSRNDGKNSFWTTYYIPNVSCKADENTTVYTVTLDETHSVVSLNQIHDNIIPMETAVVLKSTKSTINLTRLIASASYDNDLVGTSSYIQAPENSYALTKGSHGVGFYKCGVDTHIPAKHAYLIINGDSGGTRSFFALDDGDAAITHLESLVKPYAAPSAIYDLQGHKVTRASQSGIYIQDGRLVLKKRNY